MKLPTLLTADAYNTLYAPHTSIANQYNAITKAFGVTVPNRELEKQYSANFKLASEKLPNYGKTQGISVTEFWHTMLGQLYGQFETKLGKARLDEMINALVLAFQRKEQYSVYTDFVEMAKWAKENEIPLKVASNADAGVTRLIIEEFGMKQYLKPDDLYLSYDLDVSKPDPAFFRKIVEREAARLGKTTDQLLESAWHVGDEYDKDVTSALEAGLGAILVDRDNCEQFLQPNEEIKKIGQRTYVVRSLYEVPKLFDQDA